MGNKNAVVTHPDDEVPVWFHDGMYGKIKATALNNYLGTIEAGKWYTFHHLVNGNFWLYRLDDATDEETARIHSGTMAREGDYPVIKTEVFKCISAPARDQIIVHHVPTDTTRPVVYSIEGELGPIMIKFLH